MKNAIPDLMSANVFEPDDLALMQSVFEQVCKERGADHVERRAAIAVMILDAFKSGIRDRDKLLEVVMAAAT